MISEESHEEGIRMEAACGESAEGAGARVHRIDVEGLGVEVSREGDDLIIGHAQVAIFVDGPRVIILEVAFLDWHSEVSVAQRSGLESMFRNAHGQ